MINNEGTQYYMCIKLQTDQYHLAYLIIQCLTKKTSFFSPETTVCNQYLANSVTLAYTLAISFGGALRLNILFCNRSIYNYR